MSPFLNLANRLYEVIVSNINCLNNWGIYLFNPDFDNEPELRNKIGTIWLCSQLDTYEAHHRHIPEVVQEAKKNNWPSLIHNAKQIRHFCYAAGEVLNKFSREEQIFLVDFRNQLVHSYLRGRHSQAIKVKYYSNGQLMTESLSWKEYSDITKQFYEKAPLDEVLAQIIKKALDPNLHYWQLVNYFDKNKETLYKLMREGKTFSVFPS